MDKDTLIHLAALSKLQLTPDEIADFTPSLTQIIQFTEPLQQVNTEGIAPLIHPIEINQPLRPDLATAEDWRKQAMQLAAASEQDHFLVPQVID